MDVYTVPNSRNSQRQRYQYTVAEAIEEIGIGRVQWFAIFASALCLMHYLLDVLGVGLILPAATCELQLDTKKKGLLLSAPFLGLILTGHIWGFLADTIGRRKTVLLSLSSSVGISMLAALTQPFWAILTLRLFAGMANAGSTSSMYPYVGELLTSRRRSKLMVLICYAASTAMFLMSAVAWLMQRYASDIHITETYVLSPWRQQIILLSIPGIIGSIIFYLLPESPKFLVSIGERDKALVVLQWIYEANGNAKKHFPIKALKEDGTAHFDSKKTILSVVKSFLNETKSLFQGQYLWPMLGMCYIQYGLFTVGSAFAVWYPEITNRLKISGSEAGTQICDILSSRGNTSQVEVMDWNECVVRIEDKMYIDNLIIGLGYFISTTIIFICNSRIQMRFLISAAMGLSSFSAFLLPSLSNELLIVICFTVFIIGCGATIVIFNVLVVETFPTFICGMALGLCLLVGRLGTFLGANAFGILLESSCVMTIYGVAIMIGLCVVCVVLLPRKIEK